MRTECLSSLVWSRLLPPGPAGADPGGPAEPGLGWGAGRWGRGSGRGRRGAQRGEPVASWPCSRLPFGAQGAPPWGGGGAGSRTLSRCSPRPAGSPGGSARRGPAKEGAGRLQDALQPGHVGSGRRPGQAPAFLEGAGPSQGGAPLPGRPPASPPPSRLPRLPAPRVTPPAPAGAASGKPSCSPPPSGFRIPVLAPAWVGGGSCSWLTQPCPARLPPAVVSRCVTQCMEECGGGAG